MRKVTASAVILTALTGCGHNSGIPSTQWSFEIPSEDQISSLELGQETSAVADATLVSAVDSQVRSYGAGDSFETGSGGSSTEDMMGPAFSQPSDYIGTISSNLSESSDSALSLSSTGLSSTGLSSTGSYSSLASTGASTGGYQPVAVRPDPVAQVKAFLSANGSPSALVNREPYRSDVMTPALPAVYLPTPASITATLGDPTGMESQVAFVDDGSFTSVGLPAIESSGGGWYSTASDYSASGYSAGTEVAAVSSNAYPVEAFSDASPDQPLLTASNELSDSGLPMLEPSTAEDTSIGTAILQDLQARQPQTTQVAQSAPALPVQSNAGGGIDIEITSAEVAEPSSNLVASAWEAGPEAEPSATNDGPTLESLTRSMAVREVSPLVAYASQSETSLAVESIARTTPHADFPTLESLLETMPETATQPNFAVDFPENNAASPLLEGLSSAEPLSTLYMPIPEADLASSADANLSVNVGLIRGSLASLADILPTASSSQNLLDGALVSAATQVKTSLRDRSLDAVLQQRNKAILSLVDKSSAKRRQLVTY